MSRRRAWWTAGGLLLVVLLAYGAWRLSLEIPDRLRKAEETIREDAARYGLRVSFVNLRLHLLYPRASMDNLVVVDGGPGTELLRAEHVDISLSPGRLLSGESPVSRIRLRDFALRAEDANRPVFDRLRSGQGTGAMPEILLLNGQVRIGPFGGLRRLEAKVPEARIRAVKFLGRRLSFSAADVSGEIVLPGGGASTWPFAALDADLFEQNGAIRIRKIRATGSSAAIRISGVVQADRTYGEMSLSGSVDLDRWISAGAPYSGWIGKFAEKGNVEFSATLSGDLGNPDGSGNVTLRNGRIHGGTAAEAELAVALSKRKLRVEALRGRLWGGALSGNGSIDLVTGRGEGKASLTRAHLGTAPWREWGFAWRPAGAGDAEIALSGDRRKIHAAISWRNPAGLERADGRKGNGPNVRLPLSADAAGDYAPDGRIALQEVRVRAGESLLSGSGEIDLPGKSFRLAGDFSIPAGKASDYGWNRAVSWSSLAGAWDVRGTKARQRVSLRVEAKKLASGSFPPVPMVAVLEGDTGDTVHFVADIPASFAKATATGTFTGPFSMAPPILDATVALRDIDFAENGRWLPSLMAALGREPGDAARYAGGVAGRGSADLQISLAGGVSSVAGSLHSPALRLRGLEIREVALAGKWRRSSSTEAWEAAVDAKLDEGTLRLEGGGEAGSAEITGTIDRLDIDQVASLFGRGERPRLRGSASIRVAASVGEKGWEVKHLSASVPRLAIDNTMLEEASAEGSLGADGGTFVLAVRSPVMRLAADVRRGGEWPTRFTLTASGVPTEFLLSAAGREDLGGEGKWSAEAEGTVSAYGLLHERKLLRDAVASLRFSLSGDAPAVSGIAFKELRLSGTKRGDVLAGEVRSRSPDTRLAFSVALREPFGFRLEGPFSFASETRGNDADEGRARFALSGSAEINGSLLAISKTTGSIHVGELAYRQGNFDLTGKGITANLSDEGVRWTGGALAAEGTPLNVSGKVSWEGDLDVRLEGRMPAAAIRLVTDVFDRLDGSMRLDVRLSGKWDAPRILGTGHLDGGVFSFRGYAQLFEDMQVEATISREKLIFEHFEGRSGGGYLDGRGELPLRFDAHQRLFFSVDFFDMRFPYPDDFRPVLQGHAELLGPYDDFLVTGDVEIQSARYTKTLRPEKVFVDFRRRLADVTARRETGGFRVRLDINAIADGTIKIKNNLADVDVKGEFKVVGDASRVIILGAFDVLEGFVEYQGNRYDLKRASVEFQDPRRNNPRLDARAETTKGNVTVVVSVTGTLDRYEVELTSDPPLSKNDIVSLLSLGVTTQALAGSEGTVGAAAASSLVLGPYKGRFEEGIRGIVRLDKFAIEPSFSASSKSFEPKFIVGKSFGDRFTVSVSTSVATVAESSATAEYKLFENVYLSGAWESATTTTEGDLGADIKIRYRYRQFKDFLRGRD